jgi:hypothetical protein
MTTPHPTGPAVVVRKPWYRRVPAALFVGIAVFVGVVLLASYQYWPNLFVVPHTFAGLILWVVKLLLFAGVIVGLIWLLLLVLGSTVVGSIVVIAMALLLALPFLFSLVAGMRAGAHNAQSQATARPTVTEPTTVRPTVTEPTTITPTETVGVGTAGHDGATAPSGHFAGAGGHYASGPTNAADLPALRDWGYSGWTTDRCVCVREGHAAFLYPVSGHGPGESPVGSARDLPGRQ